MAVALEEEEVKPKAIDPREPTLNSKTSSFILMELVSTNRLLHIVQSRILYSKYRRRSRMDKTLQCHYEI